ncbi:guanine nucleotide-binding protein-like 1 [Schistocerca americana]|uniref:guanine nucleotide-binding protein-like 1 n=1 Tax=Schistocerca americana TaxID=7009 RepID=UPI001F501782|nr:guanine nucleotide-binding protein-like 1 [Schistocerca americana]
MPQGRRKVPFSAKAKKMQLQNKRKMKGGVPNFVVRGDSEDETSGINTINKQPSSQKGRGNANRYALQFHRETEAEIRERKEAARHALLSLPETSLEIDGNTYFPPDLDFPKRPPWNFDMSREELEAREHRYFNEYLSDLEKKYDRKELSYFELNLETWRQLWRVLEMSDIILIIVDIRYAALMFPPSLYHHVQKVDKSMILVLNKIDLCPAPVVAAWMHYFKERYPSLHILIFTSFPSYNIRGNQENRTGLQTRRRRGKLRMAAEGAQKLLEACKDIVKDEVDLSSWQSKISEEMETEYECDDLEIEETVEMKKVDTSYIEHVRYREGALTIGCIGQPNVGKSSLMNAIMGKKVVSVSRTPGHTKHFQTIYLTSNVRLCDCPGLVFPSKVPKTLQVLMGSYPIAQLREPYSAIQFLGERMDLPHLLQIKHPEGDEEWSAVDICDGWAQKRGFFTARTSRLDSYRAANHLLRMALDGKICLCMRPAGYSNNKELWENHEYVETVHWVQAKGQEKNTELKDGTESSDEESDTSEKQISHENTGEKSEGDSEEEDDDEEEESVGAVGYSNKFMGLDTSD